MALLTSYGATNRVVDSALVVTYSNSLISGMWSWLSFNMWGTWDRMREIHRRARKSYRYVGMTESAAQQCKAAMIAKYTRDFWTSIWDGNSAGGSWTEVEGGSMPMADVAMSHNEDGSYDVIVNVNEDDSRMCLANSGFTYTSMGRRARRRDYDGETETSQQETSQEESSQGGSS